MFTVIIGDGLTNDVLGQQNQFLGGREHVGLGEAVRLVGKGRARGDGPLPFFLRQGVAAAGEGADVGVILLGRDRDEVGREEEPGKTTKGTDFIESVASLVPQIRVIASESLGVPAEALLAAIREIAGKSPQGSARPQSDVRVLVIGCHTEKRVLAIATLLRTVLGYEQVAVAAHLVGSATRDAHFAVLRHNLPSAGVGVLLGLEEAAEYAGLDSTAAGELGLQPCVIAPAEVAEALEPDQRRIIELLCMHWTRVRLRPLAGGFSGSLLLLASGWKGEAQTEPMVLKIDAFDQMRREISGYHEVKDFFGKHVPTFGYPVVVGNLLGVGMELAAMEGAPQTLQDTFESADSETALEVFLAQLDKALELLSAKLYGNTRVESWVAPYRVFGVHAEQQLTWLRANGEQVLAYVQDVAGRIPEVDIEQVAAMLKLAAGNEDGVESEVCLEHGDLNYANVICDAGNNIWFIDWTHSGHVPIERDFVKLENDAKFVMSKAFDLDDLGRLQKLEDYLLEHRLPPEAHELPDNLKFVKWDLRFRKILETVRRVRRACFDLKQTDDWLVYRVGLLCYALHTLSFDKRRDRGECEPVQLMHALYSVESLTFNLVADDFHLRIRAERPESYPRRQRISIDEAPWLLDCDNYDPPYHVDPSVLSNDRSKLPEGWADPEQFDLMPEDAAARATRFKDDEGRPLNPRGRTGIAGRGLLGSWGANHTVAAVAIRSVGGGNSKEILLGQKTGQAEWVLPTGFLLPDEDKGPGVDRIVATDTGWTPAPGAGQIVFEGLTYDPRQTDHAWVESHAYLFDEAPGAAPDLFEPGPGFEEVVWRALDPDIVNRVPSGQARFIRDAIRALGESGSMDADHAAELLARTG